MLFFTAEQLEKQGVSYQEVVEASQIKCSGRLYSRVSNFARSEREAAKDTCRRFIKEGIFSFVSESSAYLTVWREQKQELSVPNKPSLSLTSFNQPVAYDILSKKTSLTANVSEPQKEPKKQPDYQIFIRTAEEPQETQVEKDSLPDLNIISENLKASDEAQGDKNLAIRTYRGITYVVNSETGDLVTPESNNESQSASDSKKSTRMYRGVAY